MESGSSPRRSVLSSGDTAASLEDADSLPEPDELAQEIAEDLQAAMLLFVSIAGELKE
jgi:hypothetical protein